MPSSAVHGRSAIARFRRVLVSAVALAAASPALHAAEWYGRDAGPDGSALWSDPANWDAYMLPTANASDLTTFAGHVAAGTNIDLAGSRSVSGIRLNNLVPFTLSNSDPNGVLSLAASGLQSAAGGAPVTIATPILWQSNSAIGACIVDAPLIITGSLAIQPADWTLQKQGASELRFDGSVSPALTSTIEVDAGTLTFTNQSRITFTNPNTASGISARGATAVLRIDNGTQISTTTTTGGVIDAGATATVTGVGTSWTFNGLGIGQYGAGSLTLSDHATLAGSVHVTGQSGSTGHFRMDGASHLDGYLMVGSTSASANVVADATITGAGTRLTGTGLGIGSATTPADGSVTISDGATLTGSEVLFFYESAGGLLTVDHATLKVSGLDTRATLGATPSTPTTNLVADPTNDVALELTGTSRFAFGTSTTYDGVLVGAGSLVKSGATSTQSFTKLLPDFHGSVHVKAGTLNFYNGLGGSGDTLIIDSGATLGGTGVFARAVHAAAGSFIRQVTTSGSVSSTLELGDAARTDGVEIGGVLQGQVITLHDANLADVSGRIVGIVLTLNAPNGILLSGSIAIAADANSYVNAAVTNLGTIGGQTTGTHALLLNGLVDGTGNYTGQVAFNKGLSLGTAAQPIAHVTAGTLTFGASSLNTFSVGDLGADPAAADRIDASGNVTLAGTLVLDPRGIDAAPLGSTARFITAGGTLTGRFKLINGIAIDADRALAITYAADGVDVTLARTGDANLDQAVDFADLLTLARDYGQTTGQTWSTGDFDGNGAVNFADLLTLAKQYGQSTPASAVEGQTTATFAADWALAQALAPEPSVFAALTLGWSTAARRRGRLR